MKSFATPIKPLRKTFFNHTKNKYKSTNRQLGKPYETIDIVMQDEQDISMKSKEKLKKRQYSIVRSLAKPPQTIGIQQPRSVPRSSAKDVKRQRQIIINPDEIITKEFNKRKQFLASTDYILVTNDNIINFDFKTGNNLSYELPFIIAKQELINNIIGRGNTNLDNYKIRTLLSSLSLIKDEDDNSLIDNINDVKKFDKCISNINETQKDDLYLNSMCLRKYTDLKPDDEQNLEDTDIRNTSSMSKRWSSSITGGNPITDAYLQNHHIFDNKHDFKSKCPKKNNSLCFKSMYGCDAIIGHQNAKAELQKECDPMVESKIFLNYINNFTNNDLKNFIYISFFDLNKVKLNINLFNTMKKSIQTNYDSNIESFMLQFTKTTNPTFFTDGVLSKGQLKNLSKFLENFKTDIPQSEYSKIKKNLEAIYNKDFIVLNQNFNDFINKRQIISLETVNDPMATDSSLYKKYFKNPTNKYSENKIEIFAKITSEMTSQQGYNNIFTHPFCIDHIDFVYYKKQSPTNEISFAMRFKHSPFTNFIYTHRNKLNKFNVLYLEKETTSNVYKEINPTNTSNVFIGFDLKKYKTYNSNNRISSIINDFISELTQGIIDITVKYLKETDNSREATAFIILYYLFINDLVVVNQEKFKNKQRIDINKGQDISRILFDLKKAGDLSKVLFAYYYTELNDKYQSIPTDKVSIGLQELKDPNDGLIKDQLIFSSNDTLAVLSGILRNKNDIFFNMQSCYSYFSYRTSDTLKLTLYDIYEKIKLSFGTKFIRPNFDISKSFDDFISKNNIYADLHKICNKNTKTVILRNKENKTFEDFIQTTIISVNISVNYDYYYKLFKLYTLSYFELYFKDFYYNFYNIVNKDIIKENIREYLFNSLSDNDRKSQIIKNIVDKYIDKIFDVIDKLLQEIYSKLVESTKTHTGDVIDYYDSIFLKQIELYQNIILLIEQFLCFNKDETNFFINLANLNKFTNQIVNLYFVSSDENKNLTLPKIKKMDDINMLIVCLSDTEFASFINTQKDVTKFNTDLLIKKLGIFNFIKNLEIFNSIFNNIGYLSNVTIDNTDIKQLFDNFVYQIKKLSYFIVIQNIVPFYFLSKQEEDGEEDIYKPNDKNYIISFIIDTIKSKIEEAFDIAKQNKIKPIEKKITPNMRDKLKENFEKEITKIGEVYDNKKISIVSTIEDLLTTKLQIFFNNDFLKNLENDESIFFYTSPVSIIEPQDNELKLNYNLSSIFEPPNIPTFPTNFSKITLPQLPTSTTKEANIRNQLIGIYNFLISDRRDAITTTPMQSGGNNRKKTKKLKKY